MKRTLLLALATAGLASAPSAATAGDSEPAVTSLCVEPTHELDSLDAAPGDEFGALVAVCGDTVVVASPTPPRIDVFVREGGAWVPEGRLETDEPTSSLFGGLSIDIDGDTVVVGRSDDDEVVYSGGAAYVFVRDAGTWTREAKLFSDDVEQYDRLGTAVSIQGDRLLAGAPGFGVGAAYVFERSGGTWTQAHRLDPDDGTLVGSFGCSVSLADDVAAIGAYTDDSLSSNAGSAYVFTLVGDTWVLDDKLYGQIGEQYFGRVVAASSDTVAVGRGGSVDLWTRSEPVWTHRGRLVRHDSAFDESFGERIALSGDRLAVGAPEHFPLGSAYLFRREGEGWVQGTRVDSPFQAAFGTAVALDGDRLVVGATDCCTRPGTAFAYDVREMTVPASVATRNGGTNPASYTAGPAVLGHPLQLRVDTLTTGHAMALVLAYDSPFELTLGGGQTLLCLDLLGYGELFDTGFAPGPIARIELAVPDVAALAGVSLHTQAVHAFGVSPFALSNAQDLVIGACP